MAMRTTKSTVTFVRPFRLGAFGEQLPAGRYPIETDEELLEGMSFPAYRRTATMMQLIADPLHPSVTEIAMVDPQQLEEALAADAVQAPVIQRRPGEGRAMKTWFVPPIVIPLAFVIGMAIVVLLRSIA